MGLDPSESFRQLRPICIKLSKEPSPQNIKDLECKLRTVDATHLSQLVEYVLFPLKLALQSPNATNELQETAVGCMETLFTRACVSQLGTFEEIFSYLCMLLNSKDSGLGQVADIPEELKLAIVNCLSCLIQHTSLVVKGAFFSPHYLPVLGHAVSILLALAEKEKAKNLKLSALGCLVNLAFCSETKSEQDEDREALENAIKDSLSLTFTSFIPGISIALCRVITGDTKQGHAVIMQAVELRGDILSLVMNDKYNYNMPVKPAENEDVISQLFSFTTELNSVGELANENANISDSNPEEQDKIQSLKVNRTAHYGIAPVDTPSKLKIVMERMKIISVHPNWKVRLSLIKFCDKLLTNCLGSLQTCLSTMVVY
ncbi:unnamed protein product [Porites evermanni]|uniref:TTI1 N-terminal TPR domain-containing protein n=1 Tax=Porites evermanni TaxID=104178 RepID=A0ABN8M9R5_9CNID|nr:unnamed protein product [Porites evermanni]